MLGRARNKYTLVFNNEFEQRVLTRADKSGTLIHEFRSTAQVSALNTLGFQLTSPSPLAFLQRMVKVQECTPEHVSLCQYLLELTLCHYRSIRDLPSHLAAAALFLANKIMKVRRTACQ